MIMDRVSFQENRLIVIRYQASRAIPRTLPGTHPVLPATSRFRTDVRKTMTQDLAISPLSLDVCDLGVRNQLDLVGLSGRFIDRVME